jgi:hypothetical protein
LSSTPMTFAWAMSRSIVRCVSEFWTGLLACLLTVLCSFAAPLVRDVSPAWHLTRFNGSFLHENVYRRAAGPEVDAAWAALGVDCELGHG